MGSLVVWWVVVEGLGLVAFPIAARIFAAADDRGYPFARIIALLLLTYVSWILACCGVPFRGALFGTLVALVITSAALAAAQRGDLAAWLGGGGRMVLLRHMAVWTAGFVFFAWQRALSPDIFGAEKYMDFAFFNTLTRTDVMPPQDPWMAGKPFNYYYFGYLMFANLARLTPVPNHIAYNLCVATVAGLAIGGVVALALRLTQRWNFALIAGGIGIILGNLDGFLQVWEKGTLTQIDYWRSSRVVAKGDTINEFPFFSAIHGDLHPHYMVLPATMLLLGLLLDRKLFAPRTSGDESSFTALVPFALLAFVLGAMIVISPWEAPVGWMISLLLAGRFQPLLPLLAGSRLTLVLRMLGVLIGGYLLFLPFYLGFSAPTVPPGPSEVCIGSACIKLAQTSLAEFLTVFGGLLFAPGILLAVNAAARLPTTAEARHLLLAAVALAIVAAGLAGNAVVVLLGAFVAAALVCAYAPPTADAIEAERTPLLVVLAAGVALLACELFYLKDPYGEKLYRMNTVFKLYFQGWILLSIAAPWCLQRLLARPWGWPPLSRLVATGFGALMMASAAYPLGLTLNRWGGAGARATLDGTAYLAREHPDDFAAIDWLRRTVHGLPVILEATGDPYSYYARFSANTGLPTVMGWANHEGLWRSHEPEVEQRKAEVRRSYDAVRVEDIAPVLDRYRVEYVLVGDLERKDHARGIEKFSAWPVAFRQGNTTVYRRGN
jgi:YYY domain-containing protein